MYTRACGLLESVVYWGGGEGDHAQRPHSLDILLNAVLPPSVKIKPGVQYTYLVSLSLLHTHVCIQTYTMHMYM